MTLGEYVIVSLVLSSFLCLLGTITIFSNTVIGKSFLALSVIVAGGSIALISAAFLVSFL